MDIRSRKAQLVLAAVAMLSIAAPPAIAQMPPNVTVTETTTLPTGLVKVEVTVTTPTGQLVSKTETIFDPATNQVVKQEKVTVMNGTVTTVEEKFVNGQVVQREIETITIQNGQQVKVQQEFRLVNGQLVLVQEEREVEAVQAGENQLEVEEAENKNEIETEDHNGAESGHESGGDHGGDSDGGHD